MARSSGTVTVSGEFEGAFFHAPSQTRYAIRRENDSLRLDWDAGSVLLSFFIGSRRMGRSYAFAENGYVYQAPVGYYANKAAWDMAPGYALDRQPDFDRPITPECLFCHTSGARAEPATLNRIANLSSLSGIDCERCHGQTAQHIITPRRDNIVNPARLRATSRSAVCEQCHLAGQARIVIPSRSLERFQPGEELSDYLDVFIARNDKGVRVNGHAEALARSLCAGSGELWCGTCHNLHRPVSTYREKCLACHSVDQCRSPKRNEADCSRCHMPKARAHDGGHTVFTDHSIPRKPQPAEAKREAVGELSPYFDRKLPESIAQRNLGMAYASIGVVAKAWQLLRAAAQTKPRDAALYAQMGLMLEADRRFEQAIEFYRLSLKINAGEDTALVRLGILLAKHGSAAEARRLLQSALTRNPRQPEVKKAIAALAR
jgi:hypothetical protein